MADKVNRNTTEYSNQNGTNTELYMETEILGNVNEDVSRHQDDQSPEKETLIVYESDAINVSMLQPNGAHSGNYFNEPPSQNGDIDNTSNCYYSFRTSMSRFLSRNSKRVRISCLTAAGILYIVYLSAAMYLHGGETNSFVLIAVTAVLCIWLAGQVVGVQRVSSAVLAYIKLRPKALLIIKRVLAGACVCVAGATLVTEVIQKRPSNLKSLFGVALITGSAYLTSTAPHKVRWRPVLSGLLLQYLFALAIIRVTVIRSGFSWVASVIDSILSFSGEGKDFLFGTNYDFTGFIFFLVPTVILAMALLTMMEHFGLLHILMRIAGRFLALCLGCSPAESLNAAANIFLGPIDALMIINPFLERITASQLHCLMANGMSTVTGSIMGVYIMLGISAEHLLAASVMSAPAALGLAKLSAPETQLGADDMLFEEVVVASRFQNVMDAASSGAMTAMKLAASIVANVTFVVSFMKMLNAALSWVGGLVDLPQLSLQLICSYAFYPLAISMGVDFQDGRKVASLIGVKTFVNEIVAYATVGSYGRNRVQLERYIQSNYTDWYHELNNEASIFESIRLPAWNETLPRGIISERSEVITTYALCGFANFICVGVLLGCYCVLVPNRKDVIYSFVLRAMVIGNCASFLTASVAGLFY